MLNDSGLQILLYQCVDHDIHFYFAGGSNEASGDYAGIIGGMRAL